MSCTGNCDQGRNCTCGEIDSARDLIEQITDWAGIIAALFMASAVIGLFVGIAWVWL
jgi:hypothetical protein